MSESVYVRRPGLTSGRYTAGHGGQLFDTWGGYYISADLMERRFAEGRTDTARHSFRYLDQPPNHEGMGYFTQNVECDRCGETRRISCSLDQLNRQERWCVPSVGLGSDGLGFLLVLLAAIAGTFLVVALLAGLL